MVTTREPKTIRSRLAAPSGSGAGDQRSRLAHWPPPRRAKEAKPVIVRHEPGEEPKLAKPRGWRLTRALFSEFSDD